MKFKEHLNSLDHLVKDSIDLTNCLSRIVVPARSFFWKIDIKEYFMTGTHSQLSDKSVQLLAHEDRKSYSRAILFALENQFLECKHVPAATWQCINGSGMGMNCSGEISDATFYILCEQRWACSRRVQQHHQIYLYKRFEDDILIISGSPRLFGAYLNEMKRRARPYRLQMDEYSEWSVRMLDLSISKGRRWHESGLLDVSIAFKETSLGVPLFTIFGATNFCAPVMDAF